MPTYGSATFTNNNQVTLVRSGVAFDGSAGSVWEESWVGTSAGIATKYAEVIALGGKARRGSEGGAYTLTVAYARDPDDVSDEVAVDEWEFDLETFEMDLFAWAPAIIEADAYGNVADYRKLLVDAATEGDANPHSNTTYPVANYIYKLLTRGVTSIPLNRPVLSRNRTFSAAYSGRNQSSARQTIWTTDALVAAFAIPASVQALLPDNPPTAETPLNTTWAWRLSVDRSQFSVSEGKWTEMKSWQFGAWVESFFNVVS